jgi:hypothetical protein
MWYRLEESTINSEKGYQDSLAVAKEKGCITTDYPISSISEFEQRTNALLAKKKLDGLHKVIKINLIFIANTTSENFNLGNNFHENKKPHRKHYASSCRFRNRGPSHIRGRE